MIRYYSLLLPSFPYNSSKVLEQFSTGVFDSIFTPQYDPFPGEREKTHNIGNIPVVNQNSRNILSLLGRYRFPRNILRRE